jgi:hypothetical protein
VATRQWSLFLLSGAMSILAGCGGGTTANVQNPPAPAAAQVSIAFQPTPPSSVVIGGSASITAAVSNDGTNAGVDWSLNCPNTGNCGSLNPLHTASGQATSYTPPATLSSNTQGVSIFAFATAEHSKNVNTLLTVTSFAGFLKAGTYVVETTGADPFGFPHQRVAAIVLDGNGAVQKGEETVNFLNQNTSVFASVSATVIGGSYFIGPDGRGTLTINTADIDIGQQGVETFSLVALSSSQALLTKTDIVSSNLPFSNESSVGTMDFQTLGGTTTGGYALVVRGTDVNNSGVAFGGVLNIDGPQSVSGTGSKFDEVLNGSGIVTPSASVSGSVSAPDALGAIKITLNTDFGAAQVFSGYVIDASHMKLIETDGSFMTAGIAIGQGPLTGAFSTFSGAYTLGIFGQDLSGSPATLAAAASFSAGAGSLTSGSIDELQSGLSASVQVSDGFSATYTVDPSGRVDTGSSFTFANVNNGTGPDWVFYLTGSGNPVLVLDADTEPSLGGGGVGTGLAYTATVGATFSGDYGLSFTQNFTGTEGDSTGQICVNGNSVTCPLPSPRTPNTLSGTVDQTLGFSPLGPSPLTDGFQASAVNGRLTGTLSDTNFFNNPLSVAFYLIDSSHGFFVETDGGAGETNQGVLTFGYFAGRLPVCQGCP